MNKILKNTLILTAITVIAGTALGLVYEITKDPIAKAEEATAQAAYKAVFEDADSFSTYDFDAEDAGNYFLSTFEYGRDSKCIAGSYGRDSGFHAAYEPNGRKYRRTGRGAK